MTKEMYVSSTPHETKVAVTEDDQLAEIFFERENEYTLAGSIYKGRVTRVLPGMQSAFVDIGLERDAFLYVSDFLDLEEEDEDLEEVPAQNFVSNKPQSEPHNHEYRRTAEDSDQPDAPEAVAEERAQGGYRDHGDEGSRGGRRRRRGRRGRGFPESKFARGSEEESQVSEDSEMPEESPSYPRIVLPGESISKYQRSEAATAGEQPEGEPFVIEGGFDGDEKPEFERPEAQKQFAEPEGPKSSEESAEPKRERREAPVSQRILLPGESIAKYQKKAQSETSESAEPEIAAAPKETVAPEAPSPAPVERPVHRINLPPAPFVLPGESISKYRKQAEPEQVPEEKAVEAAASVAEEMAEAPAPVVAPVEEAAAAPVEQETAAPVEEVPKPKHDEPRTEVRMERRSTIAPFILPGESIAKYRRMFERRAKTAQQETEQPPEEKLAEEASEMVASNEPLAVTLEREISAEPTPQVEEPTSAVPEPFVSEHGSTRDAIEATPEPTVVQSEVQPEAEEEHRFEEMNVASTFAGDIAEPPVESEQPIASTQSEYERAQVEHEEVEEEEFQAEPDRPSPEEIESTRAFMREAQGIALDPAGNQFRHPFAPGEGDLEEEEIEEEDESDYRMYSHDEESGDYVELEEEVLDSAARNGEAVEANGLTDAIEDEIIDEETSEAEYPAANGTEEHAEDDLGDEFEEAEMEADGSATPDAGTPEYRRGARPRFDRRRGGRRGPGGRPMRPRREHRPMPLISDLLKEGQEVLIQIAKEPIGKKGARITSHIALPGRFLVYMPTVNHIGVSRKINSDEERQRLKRIMISEREGGHGGFIVRTAAAGVGEDELRADIRFLKTLWADIKHRFESNKAPSLIYHDLNLVERILRDQVTSDFTALWVDTESEYERLVRFANRFQPSLVRKIKLYTKTTPLFEQFNIQSELDKALKSKVWLKSGGYIVINQTEALVAIDINTGKYVGKTARLEDTIVKTNIDAIKEIVRQIRLRDLGGIIVIDFIDMDERKNRQKVMQALEEALRADRAPSKVLQFNDFGLVAITRKRVKQSLERTLGEPCSYCTGTGLVKSVTTVCNEIYVEMRKMTSQLEKGDVLLRVNPEVAKALKAQGGRWMQEMEDMTQKNILIKSDPLLHQEHFDIEG